MLKKFFSFLKKHLTIQKPMNSKGILFGFRFGAKKKKK